MLPFIKVSNDKCKTIAKYLKISSKFSFNLLTQKEFPITRLNVYKINFVGTINPSYYTAETYPQNVMCTALITILDS